MMLDDAGCVRGRRAAELNGGSGGLCRYIIGILN